MSTIDCVTFLDLQLFRRIFLLASILLAFATATASAQTSDACQTAYSAATVTVPFAGAVNVYASGLNDHGDLVGYYFVQGQGELGFVLIDGKYTTIADPTGRGGAVNPAAINNRGDIAVNYLYNQQMGYLLRDGVFTSITYPGAIFTQLAGINDRDQIVGTYVNPDYSSHGFLYDHGVYTGIDLAGQPTGHTQLAGINDRGEIVGNYYSFSQLGPQGFMYFDGSYSRLETSAGSPYSVYSINNHGDLAGTDGLIVNGGFVPISALNPAAANILITSLNDHLDFLAQPNLSTSQLFTPGGRDCPRVYTFTEIRFPGSIDTYVYGINAQGSVVGDFVDGTGYHGFLRKAGEYTSFDAPFPSAGGTEAYGINAHDEIVGTYNIGLGDQGYVLKDGIYHELNFPGEDPNLPFQALLTGINDAGEIVGGYEQMGVVHSYLYHDGKFDLIAVAGASNLVSRGINNRGEIVGWDEPEGDPLEGFEKRGNHVTQIVNPQSPDLTEALAINDRGEIVGSGYLLDDGEFAPIQSLSSFFTLPQNQLVFGYGINDSSQIAGTYFSTIDNAYEGYILTPLRPDGRRPRSRF